MLFKMYVISVVTGILESANNVKTLWQNLPHTHTQNTLNERGIQHVQTKKNFTINNTFIK